MYLYLVFNKSAYRSLFYIDMILFVKTFFDFKQFYIQLSGYPANRISGRIFGEWNWISGRIPGIKKGRISGATLFRLEEYIFNLS